MPTLQAALLIALFAAGTGFTSCDSPRDPPKPPKPVTELVAPTAHPGGVR